MSKNTIKGPSSTVKILVKKKKKKKKSPTHPIIHARWPNLQLPLQYREPHKTHSTITACVEVEPTTKYSCCNSHWWGGTNPDPECARNKGWREQLPVPWEDTIHGEEITSGGTCTEGREGGEKRVEIEINLLKGKVEKEVNLLKRKVEKEVNLLKRRVEKEENLLKIGEKNVNE